MSSLPVGHKEYQQKQENMHELLNPETGKSLVSQKKSYPYGIFTNK